MRPCSYGKKKKKEEKQTLRHASSHSAAFYPTLAMTFCFSGIFVDFTCESKDINCNGELKSQNEQNVNKTRGFANPSHIFTTKHSKHVKVQNSISLIIFLDQKKKPFAGQTPRAYRPLLAPELSVDDYCFTVS